MNFEAGRQNSKVFVEGWFEPPVSGPATFFIRGDAAPGATLVWSGNESVYAYETLATSAVSKIGSSVSTINPETAGINPAVLFELWTSPTWTCVSPPCAGEMATWGSPSTTTYHADISSYGSDRPTSGNPWAARATGWFNHNETKELWLSLVGCVRCTAAVYIDGVEVARSPRQVTGHASGNDHFKFFAAAKQWYHIEMQVDVPAGGANNGKVYVKEQGCRDDTKCSSYMNDCCACDASIGMTCSWTRQEPATCNDGFVPIASGYGISAGSCRYTCVQPGGFCVPGGVDNSIGMYLHPAYTNFRAYGRPLTSM